MFWPPCLLPQTSKVLTKVLTQLSCSPSYVALFKMVSADNLNLDCLELIFAYLYGNDLVSVSLVSRSFLAGVISRLYRNLIFKLNQAKRYPAVRVHCMCSSLTLLRDV